MIIYCGEKPIVDKIKVAKTFKTRLVGLLGKKELKEGEGLLLMKCGSIHCYFMKIPIDAVYLSKDMKVLGMETVKPWRLGAHVKHARHVLEISEGSASRLMKTGDQLVVTEELG